MIIKEFDSSRDFMVNGITDADLVKYRAWLDGTEFSGCIGFGQYYIDGKLHVILHCGTKNAYEQSLEYWENLGHDYQQRPLRYLVTYQTVALKIDFVYSWLEQLRKDYKNTDPTDTKQVAHMTKIGKEAADRVASIELMFKEEFVPLSVSKPMGINAGYTFMEFIKKVHEMTQDQKYKFITSGVGDLEFMTLNYEQLELLYWGNTKDVIEYSKRIHAINDDCLEISERSGM